MVSSKTCLILPLELFQPARQCCDSHCQDVFRNGVLNLSKDFLREDTPVGTSFLRAAAHDDDQGVNAVITYSMLLQEPEYFKINPGTGWVYVNHVISKVPSAYSMSPFLQLECLQYLQSVLANECSIFGLNGCYKLFCRHSK